MPKTSVILSNQTRIDSFSDYLCIRAHEVNTLESRANISRQPGSQGLLQSWFIPMPDTITRVANQNFAQSETSLGYALDKLTSPQGQRGGAAAANTAKNAINSIGNPQNLLDLGLDVGRLALASAATSLNQTMNSYVDGMRSVSSQLTDQPVVSLSNHEMRYTGSSYRKYELSYKFIARDASDVYSETGVLSAISQLESFSFPLSRFTQSNRDLIGTPPVFTIEHALVQSDGSVIESSAGGVNSPLAHLGQPKLCFLETVNVTHDTTTVLTDDQGYTYPMITNMILKFVEMEPIVRVLGTYQNNKNEIVNDPNVRIARYGDVGSAGIVAPKLVTRSQLYQGEFDERP